MHIANRKPEADLLAVLIATFLVLTSPAQADTVVRDHDTGTSVSLVSHKGTTRVIHLATGAFVDVEGEYEGMTDEEYTQLMRNKRVETAAKKAAMAVRGILIEEPTPKQPTPQKSGSTSARFSISSSWETYDFYINATSATVTISQDLNPATINVELFRNIPWWWDKSYGTKTFSPSYDAETWTGLLSGADYYLEIRKTYTGTWTAGTWRVVW